MPGGMHDDATGQMVESFWYYIDTPM